jgi:hypothetical protein
MENGKYDSRYMELVKQGLLRDPAQVDPYAAKPVTLDRSNEVGPEADSGRLVVEKANQDYLAQLEKTQSPATDGSGEAAPADSGDAFSKGGLGAANAAASGGGKEDVLAAGLMSTGNPYAIAAGLGLKTLSTINKGKNDRMMAEYTADVANADKRRSMYEKAAQLGQNMRA